MSRVCSITRSAEPGSARNDEPDHLVRSEVYTGSGPPCRGGAEVQGGSLGLPTLIRRTGAPSRNVLVELSSAQARLAARAVSLYLLKGAETAHDGQLHEYVRVLCPPQARACGKPCQVFQCCPQDGHLKQAVHAFRNDRPQQLLDNHRYALEDCAKPHCGCTVADRTATPRFECLHRTVPGPLATSKLLQAAPSVRLMRHDPARAISDAGCQYSRGAKPSTLSQICVARESRPRSRPAHRHLLDTRLAGIAAVFRVFGHDCCVSFPSTELRISLVGEQCDDVRAAHKAHGHRNCNIAVSNLEAGSSRPL